jgi:hypothetical protein
MKRKADGKFACDCTICLEQARPEYHLAGDSEKLEVRDHLYQSGMPRDFFWLMSHLLPCNDKIKGCELIFPDTVFF